MPDPLITVLIDTYNYGRFIEEAIESVLSQDFPAEEMEVLVVDDGSTDDTAERIQKYGPRIRYLFKPNGGQGSAFNYGVAKAKGEVVALLDADDYWLPGKLKRIAQEFRRDPAIGMIYHPYLEIEMGTGEQRKSEFREISGSLFDNPEKFFWYRVPGTCASFRRSVLERILPIPAGLITQADAYIGLLVIFIAPILAIPECLAAYRFHGSNLYHADESKLSLQALESRMKMRRILVAGMRAWLAKNNFTRKQPPVRAFLEQWALYQEKDEFLLNPPGRFKFVRHLLLYNRCYAGHLSRRLRFINYVNAFGAIFTGYRRFYLLDKLRLRLLGKS